MQEMASEQKNIAEAIVLAAGKAARVAVQTMTVAGAETHILGGS